MEEIDLTDGSKVRVKTWEDIKCLDDVVVNEDRTITENVEKYSAVRCPNLQKDGKFFYYCSPNKIKCNKMSPSNPKYTKKVSSLELQLHCMSDYGACCFYTGQLKR